MTEERALALAAGGIAIRDIDDLQRFAKMAIASGLFADVADLAGACVKIQAGLELGVPPIAAMRGINIIKGKLVPDAALMLALARSRTGLEHRVTEHTDETCRIEWSRGGKVIGVTAFTFEEARGAGLHLRWDKKKNQMVPQESWKNYRQDMLFARAASRGVRRFAPEALIGAAYVPGEIADDATEEARNEAPTPAEAEVVPPAGSATHAKLIEAFEQANESGVAPDWLEERSGLTGKKGDAKWADTPWSVALEPTEAGGTFRAFIAERIAAQKRHLDEKGITGQTMAMWAPVVLKGAVVIALHRYQQSEAFAQEAATSDSDNADWLDEAPDSAPAVRTAEAPAPAPVSEEAAREALERDYAAAADGVVPDWAAEAVGGKGPWAKSHWSKALTEKGNEFRAWCAETVARDQAAIKRHYEGASAKELKALQANPAEWGDRALRCRTMLRLHEGRKA